WACGRNPRCPELDDLLCLETPHLLVTDAEQALIDAPVVVAHSHGAAPDLSRRQREFGNYSDSFQASYQVVVPLRVYLARLVVGILGHVLAVHDRDTGNLIVVHQLDDFGNTPFRYPSAEDGVE